MDKKLKIQFVPGCFDNFEGSQEELDELIQSITDGINNGSIFENSKPVDFDKLEDEDPELAEILIKAFEKGIEEQSEDRDRKLN